MPTLDTPIRIVWSTVARRGLHMLEITGTEAGRVDVVRLVIPSHAVRGLRDVLDAEIAKCPDFYEDTRTSSTD